MLEIRNLESFGNKQVLFEVDLTAQQGHILGSWKNGARGSNWPATVSCFGLAARFAGWQNDHQKPTGSGYLPRRSMQSYAKTHGF